MPEQLPFVPTEPNYRVSTSLNGTQYIFDVRWNGRVSSWYLDISTEDDEPIALGMRVVLGKFLGLRSVDPQFPAGRLIAVDLSNSGIEATLDDFGTRVVVLHFTDAEMEAFQ